MRTLSFTTRDATRIRFGVSRLWEAMASLRVLTEPGNHAVHLPWVRAVRTVVTDEAPEATINSATFRLLLDLVGSGVRGDYMPDLLTPVPDSMTPSLDAELASLRATAATVVREQLDHLRRRWSPAIQAMYDDPQGHLDILADQIERYWHVALGPHWARIHRVLEAEIFHRGQQLAAEGADALLNDLHARVTWDGAQLRVAGTTCFGTRDLDGAGLVLIPSVFVWPDVLVIPDDHTAQLAFPARGVATVWEGGFPSARAVEGVLGASKTRLLVALHTPLSTTVAAGQVGLSPAAVSEHLTALRAAGLVSSRRAGRAVLNVRTELGDALLSGDLTTPGAQGA